MRHIVIDEWRKIAVVQKSSKSDEVPSNTSSDDPVSSSAQRAKSYAIHKTFECVRELFLAAVTSPYLRIGLRDPLFAQEGSGILHRWRRRCRWR